MLVRQEENAYYYETASAARHAIETLPLDRADYDLSEIEANMYVIKLYAADGKFLGYHGD